MSDTGLWKYCTPERCKELLLSFQLFGKTSMKEEKQLSCLYALSNHAERHYRPALIPKKDGTYRRLFVPDALLMKVQKNILHNILQEMPISPYATAYHKQAAIMQNSIPHIGQKLILKLDLRDFFGSILFYMVRREVFSSLYFPPSVGTLLTYLCCYLDSLPQGAPTSPAISNLVMRHFDNSIGKWCQERQIIYTRYCDDMTFSGDFSPEEVTHKVKSYLEALGFTLNQQKTQLLNSGQRQTVTGIVVNKLPRVPSDYRRALRQEIYYCTKYGIEAHLKRCQNTKYLNCGAEGMRQYINSLLGKVNFVLQVNPQDTYFVQSRDALKEQLNRLSNETAIRLA